MKFVVSLLLVATCGVLLSGCGSSGYASTMQSRMAAVSKAISAYDSAQPSTLSSQEKACGDAAQTLVQSKPSPAASAPSGDRPTATALNRAYGFAENGLQDCAQAAGGDNYPLMIQAGTELADANVWITRAQKTGSQQAAQ